MQLFPKLHSNSCDYLIYLYKSINSVLPNFSESFTQEKGEASEIFKAEVQKYLKENDGAQTAFREEQAEVEYDSGKLIT